VKRDAVLSDIHISKRQSYNAFVRSLTAQKGGPTIEAPEERAEHGVLHGDFERRPDGFRVSFKRRYPPAKVLGGLICCFGTPLAAIVLGMKAGVTGMVFGFFLGISVGVMVMHSGRQREVIEVKGDAVLINGKTLSRNAFGGFSSSGHPLATLRYTYGARAFDFGETWLPADAAAIANSLNSHLRNTPRSL
jgi:hypothetical protein